VAGWLTGFSGSWGLLGLGCLEILRRFLRLLHCLSLWLVFKFLWQPERGSGLLDSEGQTISVSPSRSTLGLTVVVGFALVFGITFGWHSYYIRGLPAVSAPVSLRVAMGTGTRPVRLESGHLLPYAKALLPCSYGHSAGYGLEGLNELPGGPTLKKPWLLLQPTKYEIEEWADNGQIDMLFYAEVTNRGEATIAKDFTLCLMKDGQATFYRPESLGPGYLNVVKTGESLVENTRARKIEHGQMAEGWLLFRLPSKALDISSFSGSLACRDYLERQAVSVFQTDPQSVLK